MVGFSFQTRISSCRFSVWKTPSQRLGGKLQHNCSYILETPQQINVKRNHIQKKIIYGDFPVMYRIFHRS